MQLKPLDDPYMAAVIAEGRMIVLGGRVQGVGFRPFTYRLAHRYGLKGWVKNESGRLEIYITGDQGSLEGFCTALIREAPPLARPLLITNKTVGTDQSDVFIILPSTTQSTTHTHLPPDYFMCDDCLAELRNPDNRRYRYPFINCTQCGPRYTLIRRLPYDRPNTTMAEFPLCKTCRMEYEDPLDRRFHAQPLACPDCGPQLVFRWRNGNQVTQTRAALNACVKALREHNIVAIKGIGGYHLVCDAQNSDIVKLLRHRKSRLSKPLAVMFPMEKRLAALHKAVILDPAHEALLRDPMRPIVLIPARPGSPLAAEIAPGLNEVGVMLPYSPLHHLLLEDYGGPLVVTSANLSGEPVLTDNHEVETRLEHIADAFLHHDRPIQRPADDAIFRVIHKKPRPLRLGRGIAPIELELPFRLPSPLLAVGGHMKNTVTLAWDRRAVTSPHIGDLGSPRSLKVFEQVIGDLQALYRVSPQQVICDAHPSYGSTRWATRCGLGVIKICHHFAHASALCGEHRNIERWLVFTWDGLGYGADGTLWGGEALLGNQGRWRRVATFRPYYLPGGEKAALQPWRSALALCWETGIAGSIAGPEVEVLYQAWQKRINCPQTSAVGRLFDAAATLTGLVYTADYDGQAPMLLEAAAQHHTGNHVTLPLTKNTGDIYETDWQPLLNDLIDATIAAGQRAANFHTSLAHSILAQAQCIHNEHGAFTVGLSGGVFQNRLLTEQTVALLKSHGFDVRTCEQLPCNDAGLSIGQIMEAGSRMSCDV